MLPNKHLSKGSFNQLTGMVFGAVVALVVAAYSFWAPGQRAHYAQIPIEFLDTDAAWHEYLTAIKPNGRLLSAAPWDESLQDNQQKVRYLEIANETSSGKKMGIELRSLGFLARRSQDDSWLRVAPVLNASRKVVAKLVAKGTVDDNASGGATASCLIFYLQPHQIAKIPVLLVAGDIKGITDSTYAMLVKTGDDVSCEAGTGSSGSGHAGLLAPNTGTGFKLDFLPIAAGRLK